MLTARWKALGLAEPVSLDLPEHPTTADLLAYALRERGSEDPIEGILRSVERDLSTFADATEGAAPFGALARRVEVAIKLLRRADGRDPPSAKPGGGA